MTHVRGDETRARILKAAAECFTQAGYDASGVAEICARANVSKGAFYHHFPSKQALFLALFAQWIEGLEASMAAIQGTDATAVQRLIALAGLAPQVFEVAEGQIPMFLEFWHQATKDPEIWQATIEPYRRFRAAFAALIAQGVAEGSLRPVDPDTVAYVLVALAVGLVLQGALEPDPARWHGAADQAIHLLLHGLAAGGPA